MIRLAAYGLIVASYYLGGLYLHDQWPVVWLAGAIAGALYLAWRIVLAFKRADSVVTAALADLEQPDCDAMVNIGPRRGHIAHRYDPDYAIEAIKRGDT